MMPGRQAHPVPAASQPAARALPSPPPSDGEGKKLHDDSPSGQRSLGRAIDFLEHNSGRKKNFLKDRRQERGLVLLKT